MIYSLILFYLLLLCTFWNSLVVILRYPAFGLELAGRVLLVITSIVLPFSVGNELNFTCVYKKRPNRKTNYTDWTLSTKVTTWFVHDPDLPYLNIQYRYIINLFLILSYSRFNWNHLTTKNFYFVRLFFLSFSGVYHLYNNKKHF